MIRATLCSILMLPLVFAQTAPITQAELVRRTQELYDAVAAGNKAPWQRYYAEDCLFFDEKGRAMDKAALVADLTGLPAGYEGAITIVRPQSRIFADVAVLSYDADETETVFGQHLTARYHTTDTWTLRNGEWRIVASQTHRYYEDPAAGASDPSRFKDFVGTYALSPGNRTVVTAEGGSLFMQRGKRPKAQLFPEDGRIFFLKGVEGRIVFRADALIQRRNNEDVIWKRVP